MNRTLPFFLICIVLISCDDQDVTLESQREHLQQVRKEKSRHEQNISLRVRVANRFLSQGQPLEARQHLREGMHEYPKSLRLKYHIAMVNIQLEEYDKAKQALNELLKEKRFESQALLGLIRADVQQGFYDKALQQLNEISVLARQGPEAIKILHQKSLLHRRLLDFINQEKAARQAVSLNPENPISQSLLVLSLIDGAPLKRENTQEATRILNEITPQQATSPWVQVVSALHLLHNNQRHQSLALIKSLNLQELPAATLFWIGEMAHAMNNKSLLQAAAQRYSEMVGDSPQMALLHAYSKRDSNIVESLTVLRASRKLYSQDPRFHLALAELVLQKGEKEMSVIHLMDAAALAPESTMLQYKVALGLMNAGVPLKAQTHVEGLLIKHPKMVEAQFLLAELHAKTGQLDLMDAVFKKLKAQEAPCRYGWLLTVRTFQDPSRVQKGIKQLQKCVQRFPKHPTAHRYLGDAYAGLDIFGRAKRHYLAHLKLPGDEPEYDRIKQYLRRQGVKEKYIPRKGQHQ